MFNLISIRLVFIFLIFFPLYSYGQDKSKETAAIVRTGELIRNAFAKEDLETIKSFHHPEVEKALSYNKVLNGRDAVLKDLAGTLENYQLEFVENTVENILILGDLAIEQTLFSIKGSPKKEGESFVFSGRTMVTYIRYAKSPTGWATIREIIQPATK